MTAIQKAIPKNDNICHDKQDFEFTPIERIVSLSVALDRHLNITIHFDAYGSAKLADSKPNVISSTNTTKQFVKFKHRYDFSSMHGKILNDGSVNLFHYMPLNTTATVYDMRGFKQIKPRVYIYNYGAHCIAWFILAHDGTKEPHAVAKHNNFQAKLLSPPDIQCLTNLFKEFGFWSPQIRDSCMCDVDNLGNVMVIGKITSDLLKEKADYL